MERIIAASPGREILDVGCGTGISARLFQAAGCQVLGVDPDPRMAELARQGGTETEIAKFEDWDAAGRKFDTVIAAQAWHWVDPVAGAQKAAAVLRPGGRLAVFWNAFDPPDDLRKAFAEVFNRVLPGSPANEPDHGRFHLASRGHPAATPRRIRHRHRRSRRHVHRLPHDGRRHGGPDQRLAR